MVGVVWGGLDANGPVGTGVAAAGGLLLALSADGGLAVVALPAVGGLVAVALPAAVGGLFPLFPAAGWLPLDKTAAGGLVPTWAAAGGLLPAAPELLPSCLSTASLFCLSRAALSNAASSAERILSFSFIIIHSLSSDSGVAAWLLLPPVSQFGPFPSNSPNSWLIFPPCATHKFEIQYWTLLGK